MFFSFYVSLLSRGKKTKTSWADASNTELFNNVRSTVIGEKVEHPAMRHKCTKDHLHEASHFMGLVSFWEAVRNGRSRK